MTPISIHFVLYLDPQLTVTMGVKFLLFKHYFAKRKKIYKLKTKYAGDQDKKGWIIRMKSPSAKSFFHWLQIIVRERQTFRITRAAFTNLAKRIIFPADRHYLKIDLRGGLSSPDLTGQLYGFFQSFRSIPYSFISLSYRPDFMEDRLRGTIEAGTVIKIYEIFCYLIIFIWYLPKVKLINAYYNYRKEPDNA